MDGARQVVCEFFEIGCLGSAKVEYFLNVIFGAYGMTSDDFVRVLQEQGVRYVYSHCLFNNEVHIFEQNFPDEHLFKYQEFKARVSDVLGVSLQNIAIVGSAKMGFSLTPGRSYEPFDEDSDLDLIIVCPTLFRELWGGYFDYINSFTGRSYSDIAKGVFRHFVSVKAEEVVGDQLQYFQSWIDKVDGLRLQLQLEFKLPMEINYRVYEDWKYVDKYHMSGLSQL